MNNDTYTNPWDYLLTIESRKKLFFAAIAVLFLLIDGYYVLSFHTSPWFGIHADIDSNKRQATIIDVPEDSPAESAGLLPGDVILEFNSQQFTAEQNAFEWLGAISKYQNLDLVVLRDGATMDVVLQRGYRPFSIKHLSYILVGLLYISSGWWIFFSRPQYPAANALGFVSLLLGSSILLRGGLPQLYEPLLIFIWFIGYFQFYTWLAVILHFAMLFPRPRPISRNRFVLSGVYSLPIIGAAITIGLYMLHEGNSTFTGLNSFGGSFVWISVFLASFCIGLTIMTLVSSYFRAEDRSEKRRLRWIIFGTAVPLGFVLSIFTSSTAFRLTIPYYEIWFIGAYAVIPIAYFYGIVRYRAMEIELIIRRGLVYSIVTAAILLATVVAFAIFAGLPLLLRDTMAGLIGWNTAISAVLDNQIVRYVSVAVWALIVGATVGRLKRKVQEFVDRRFYREKYDYHQALLRLASVLERTSDRDRLLEIIAENADQMVHCVSLQIALVEDDGNARVVLSRPPRADDDVIDAGAIRTFSALFKEGRRYLGRREVDEEQSSASLVVKEVLDRFGADLCMLMRAGGETLGFIFLGAKRSELAYNTADIELLSMLAVQAARGIERMRLARSAVEKERIQRELEIGREIQRSFLPASPPHIEGASIAAVNIPAMEIGGDFYHFIKYSSSQVGIIIGDIVGKGVAGAINMAATISSLRLIAEESESVSDAMQWLNRYLVRTSAQRSFAAVLFAVIDTEAKTLRWSNGGLPEPVVISRESKARFLEMERYALPPGIAQRSRYQETSCILQDGDTVIFVTDGIVEACPAGGSPDQFGYDRLLQVLNKHSVKTPDELLDSLARELNEFCGSTHYEDDFTAVAVKLLTPPQEVE